LVGVFLTLVSALLTLVGVYPTSSSVFLT